MPRRQGPAASPEHWLAPKHLIERLDARYTRIDFAGIEAVLRNGEASVALLTESICKAEGIVDPKARMAVACRTTKYRQRFRILDEVLDHFTMPRRIEDAVRTGFLTRAEAAGARGPMGPHERGAAIIVGINKAITLIEKAHRPIDPIEQAMFNAAEKVLNLLLGELGKHDLLKRCPECGYCFFPTKPAKQTCSLAYEGRNCSGNRRGRTRDRKKRENKANQTAFLTR